MYQINSKTNQTDLKSNNNQKLGKKRKNKQNFAKKNFYIQNPWMNHPKGTAKSQQPTTAKVTNTKMQPHDNTKQVQKPTTIKIQ